MIKHSEIEKLIAELKSVYQWHEFKHAVRFNGIVDVWNDARTVYVKGEHIYEYFADIAQLEVYVISKLKEHKPQHAYKSGTSNKISYREFKAVRREDSNKLSATNAEDYHWKQSGHEVSEDDLYFLFHAGCVKIGRSKNIDDRVKALQTSLSMEYQVIVLPKRGGLEKLMHRCFSDFKTSREWFNKDERMVVFLRKRMNEGAAYKWQPAPKVKPIPAQETPIRLIVAGSRTFEDYSLVERALNALLAESSLAEIVSGNGRGVDKLGERYGEAHGIDVKRFPADWNTYDKRAGYIRNKQMAEYATHCICFWDGESRGTKIMIELAKDNKLPTQIVKI